MLSREAVVGRFWRACADARRTVSGDGSARSALRSFGRPRRRDLESWNRATSDAFERYRAHHPPARGDIAVVCVSMRPEFVADVARHVASQRDVDVDFVFVANHSDFDGIDLDRTFRELDRVSVLREPHLSLGAALNRAMRATPARFVAKFDDDDVYAPNYLVDSLRAHAYAGAGVIGKHSYYALTSTDGRRYLRFPGHDMSYSATLAGGTLVIDRERTGDLTFADVSLGEDRRFIRSCHRRGISTFAADRFNFVQRRRHDNTWAISEPDFLVGSVPVDAADDTHTVER